MRKFWPIMLLLLLMGCHQQATEDPGTGELRGLLSNVPTGEKIFIDPRFAALLPAGVQAVALPAELRERRQVAPGVEFATVTTPRPPLVYADEVGYLLLPSQAIQSALGCAATSWDPIARNIGPDNVQYALWRKKGELTYAPSGAIKKSELAIIAAGTAVVGGAAGKPETRVKHEAFAIEKTEVTYAQFAAFLTKARPDKAELAIFTDLSRPDNPLERHGDGYRVAADCGRHPMAFLSFAGAQAFCEYIERQLPRDEQWVIAASGGDGRTYPWGEATPVRKFANVAGLEDGYQGSAPVGSFPQGATPQGVQDMAGNAYEWTAHDGGVCLRGGAWATGPEWARCAMPETNVAHVRNDHNGFRCVAEPPQVEP
jgi:formylglycine-generating enzyme required for sulfatase activity